jgi:isopropylmalate/homocitrate/citramalate synthase
MTTPWKTDQWHVCPWNFEREVTAGLKFPGTLRIHDVTLRDGEQQAGVVMRANEKIRIAEMLMEAGVQRIEAGMPAVSREDERAIREIVKRSDKTQIFAFSRCRADDIKRAADTGVTGVVVEIPSSQHIITKAYRWPVEKAVELSIEATRSAKEYGLYTVFFPVDGSRAEMNWYLDLIERVAREGHMDALTLVDTFGVTTPHSIPFWVAQVKSRIGKPLEAHFHNDFGMAVANTLAALASGVEVAHTSVTGLGERSGNTPYEDLVLALRVLYGVDIGIDTQQFQRISRFVQEAAHLAVPDNRAIVGRRLFEIESGILAGFYENCKGEDPLELFPYHWSLVGQKAPEVILGKKSGADSVKVWLRELAISDAEDHVDEIVQAVKERAMARKGLVDEEEFRSIVASIVARHR